PTIAAASACTVFATGCGLPTAGALSRRGGSRAGSGSRSEPSPGRAAVAALRSGGLMLRRQHRLRNRGAFRRIFEQGRSWAEPAAVLHTLPGEATEKRIGVSASRK